MAKRPPKNPKKPHKEAKEPDVAMVEYSVWGKLKETTGTSDLSLQGELLNQLAGSLWQPSSLSDKKRNDLTDAAMAALEGIKPRDEIEGMLGVQMVATHNAAMACLRRAALDKQTYEGIEQNLKHASKLMTIYTRQMETLDKHRGKGQQKVTVEYVNVEAGGRAMIGNINASKAPLSDEQSANSSAKTISHNPGDTIDMETEDVPQKVKKKTQKGRR